MDFYIGFQSLTEFIAAINPFHDTYLAPLNIVKNLNYGISTSTVSLVASQVKGDHLIYCKIAVSRWKELYGKPFGQESEERAARSKHLQDQMWGFIVEKIREDYPDLDIFDGAPSFPTDLMLISGNIEGIVYDADLHEFIKAE